MSGRRHPNLARAGCIIVSKHTSLPPIGSGYSRLPNLQPIAAPIPVQITVTSLVFLSRALHNIGERAGMPELKSILSFVVLGFVLAPGTALAVDECLSKPNAPASKGQHWYYRVDRANNNRQCWRLGPEGLRVQKSEPQVQKTKPQGTVKPEPPPPTQRPATTGMAIASADVSAVGAVGTAPATGWLDVTKFPDSPPTSQPASQSPPVEPTQSIVASDSEPQVANPVVATGGVVSSTGSDDLVAQSRSTTQEPAREADDHTFALLTIMLVFLVFAGGAFHYWQRRSRRAAGHFEPPQWAPIVSMKTATPGARVPLASDSEIEKRLRPALLASADQTERLTNALEQLLDRLQTELNFDRQAMDSARRHKVE